MEIAGRARTLAEARTLLATVEAEVALLDLRLPDGSGTDLLSASWRCGRRPGIHRAVDVPDPAIRGGRYRARRQRVRREDGPYGGHRRRRPSGGRRGYSIPARVGTAGPQQVESVDASRARHHRRGPRGPIERRARCGSAHRAEDGGGLPHPALRTVRRAVTHGARDPRRTRAVAQPAGPGADSPHTQIARRGYPPTRPFRIPAFSPDRCSP